MGKSVSGDLIVIEKFAVEIHLFARSDGLLGAKKWHSWVYGRRNARWLWVASLHGSAYPANRAQKGEFLRKRSVKAGFYPWYSV